ncbi:Aste57867_21591 [Aphanomyces stellatus]|uniref:Aste57867_21591 protein n=1 Tax=Aphanomyces stellatus TaxID=120398 RepID=A0A485LK07_9STRA|nr:hypothetical protein As57867_021522 [Aphanomyces stellatus]VFT98261.1 Aste57867_21591 [Aphanomyces stellatus]
MEAAADTTPTSPMGRELKRRDSIGERIEQSIAEHIEQETAHLEVEDEGDAVEDKVPLLSTSALKLDVEEKLQSISASHQITNVLLVISSLHKHRFISSEARSVLKNQAIEEVHTADGILAAAVELFCVDWDMDECVDTFVKVGQMLLAAA